MINELSEDEILDYLMTSDFEEGLTPVEFKFLLKKFRNFFKLVNSRFVSQKDIIERLHEDIKCIKKQNETDLLNFDLEKQKTEQKFKNLLNRKLTWKERFKGKILENENK